MLYKSTLLVTLKPVTMNKNSHLLRYRNSTGGSLFAFITATNKLKVNLFFIYFFLTSSQKDSTYIHMRNIKINLHSIW